MILRIAVALFALIAAVFMIFHYGKDSLFSAETFSFNTQKKTEGKKKQKIKLTDGYSPINIKIDIPEDAGLKTKLEVLWKQTKTAIDNDLSAEYLTEYDYDDRRKILLDEWGHLKNNILLYDSSDNQIKLIWSKVVDLIHTSYGFPEFSVEINEAERKNIEKITSLIATINTLVKEAQYYDLR